VHVVEELDVNLSKDHSLHLPFESVTCFFDLWCIAHVELCPFLIVLEFGI
jgi:hypothetical protein